MVFGVDIQVEKAEKTMWEVSCASGVVLKVNYHRA